MSETFNSYFTYPSLSCSDVQSKWNFQHGNSKGSSGPGEICPCEDLASPKLFSSIRANDRTVFYQQTEECQLCLTTNDLLPT